MQYNEEKEIVYTEEEARSKCSCIDEKMRFFIWHGKEDECFPVDDAMKNYKLLFAKLNIE